MYIFQNNFMKFIFYYKDLINKNLHFNEMCYEKLFWRQILNTTKKCLQRMNYRNETSNYTCINN